jgi:hypothetical protein
MALVLMSNGPTCSGPTRFSTLKRAFLLGVHYIAPWRRRTGIDGRFGPRTTATGMRGSLPHRGDDSAAGSYCPEGTTTAGNAFGHDRTGPDRSPRSRRAICFHPRTIQPPGPRAL